MFKVQQPKTKQNKSNEEQFCFEEKHDEVKINRMEIKDKTKSKQRGKNGRQSHNFVRTIF